MAFRFRKRTEATTAPDKPSGGWYADPYGTAARRSHACTEWRFSGTHDGMFLDVPASGNKIVTLGATVQEFGEDGKIVSENAYWDVATFLREAGVLPGTTAATA